MHVLECLSRLEISTRVKDRFLFKSCSFVDACIKEDDFFIGNISSEFYCRMVVICMLNEVVISSLLVSHRENTSSIYLFHTNGFVFC